MVEYQELLKTELGKSDDEIKNRLNQIRNEIMATGTYHQTFEEISYGAKVDLQVPLKLNTTNGDKTRRWHGVTQPSALVG